MRRPLVVAMMLALGLHAVASAQQAGSNVAVLPVVTNPADPNAFLKGDLYLQRQLEPSVAVSTRNPQTVLAFFNDYRAVDVPGDLVIGDGDAPTNAGQTILAMLRPVRRFFARLVGHTPKPKSPIAA